MASFPDATAAADYYLFVAGLWTGSSVEGTRGEMNKRSLKPEGPQKETRGAVRIERAGYQDYDALVRIFVRNGLEYDVEDEVETDVIEAFKVTDADGSLKGGACLALRQGDFIIDGIAVEPEWRQRNLGSRLLDEIAGAAKRRGGREIFLVAKAPGFFRKYGFTAVDHEAAPDFFECRQCDQYRKSCFPEVMKLELSRSEM